MSEQIATKLIIGNRYETIGGSQLEYLSTQVYKSEREFKFKLINGLNPGEIQYFSAQEVERYIPAPPADQ